uniref:Rap-GAP domain-containing protein n=1 Tax=Syphacia muris TaxID=451379 RepID=A0A0N5AU55_9BILA
LVCSRRLQVSTLEAIYHETRDLLENGEEGEEPVLRMFISLTASQIEQIGLALRATFFKEICRLGLTELTLEWLIALTKNGEKVVGIEYDVVSLLKNWINDVLNPSVSDHPQALRIIQFGQQLIKWNAGFMLENCLDEITHKVCERIYYKTDHLTYECLKLLDTILKFGDIPDKKLITFVTTLCSLVNRSEIRKDAWLLMRDLLRSRSGHRTLVLLIKIIAAGKHYNDEKIVIGAVSIVTMALWGSQRVETLRCQPTAVLPAMIKGMEASPRIMKEVFISVRRLLTKYGRNLQQLSWHSVIQLVNRALFLCKQTFDDKEEKGLNLKHDLHQLISIIEDLYLEGEFAGSVEAMYALIESCADERQTESIIALIDYKAACIDPLGEKWLRKMAQLVDKYLNNTNSPYPVREKAICLLHSIYTKYHYFYEKDVVLELIVPVLGGVVYEEDVKIQYQMLNVLFDVAKTTPLRMKGDQDCFTLIMEILKTFLSAEASKLVRSDNVEVVASAIAEILNERFASLSLAQLQLIVDMQCEHLHLHYAAESTTEIGSEIRDRMFAALLSLLYDPLYNRLIIKGETPIANPRISCRSKTRETFSWQPICEVTILALQRERWSPVLITILRHLNEILEIRELVFTAGEILVKNLNDALINLFMRRADFLFENEMSSGRTEEITLSEKRSDNELVKFYCPVITRLLNYFCDERICHVLVDSIHPLSGNSGCKQAILGCDIAVQLMPKNMAQLVKHLLTNLTALKPNPILAIPIIEFFGDVYRVDEFHRFFQLNHFLTIIDILLPYANIHRFNTYIIAAVIRNLMLWYSKVPEDIRESVSEYIIGKVDSQELLSGVQSFASLSRQTSDDSTRLEQYTKEGLLVPSISSFSSEISPDSPPPPTQYVSAASSSRIFSDREVGDREKVAKEATDLLLAFLRYGRVEEDINETQKKDVDCGLVEKSVQHWIVNDSVISISVLAEPEFIQTESTPSPSNKYSDVLVQRQISEAARIDKRRRHLSATNASENLQPAVKPASLDDSFALNQVTVTFSAIASVTWVNLVVRHMFGKHSWFMRSFSEIPDDFEAVIVCAKQYMCFNLRMRSLRNLDRICSYEMQTVGVVYIRNGQTKEADILANAFGSSKYSTFISMLGEPESLDNSPGGLVPVQNGSFTYVYKDVISKIVFHIATLMPQKEGDIACNEKKKFIGNDYVTLVFNESGVSYKLGTIAGKFAYAAIEVVPQDEANVLIKLSVRREVSSWLALNRVFIPLRQAAAVVQKLALRCQLAVNIWRREEVEKGTPYLGFNVERLRYIRNFAQSHSKKSTKAAATH